MNEIKPPYGHYLIGRNDVCKKGDKFFDGNWVDAPSIAIGRIWGETTTSNAQICRPYVSPDDPEWVLVPGEEMTQLGDEAFHPGVAQWMSCHAGFEVGSYKAVRRRKSPVQNPETEDSLWQVAHAAFNEEDGGHERDWTRVAMAVITEYERLKQKQNQDGPWFVCVSTKQYSTKEEAERHAREACSKASQTAYVCKAVLECSVQVNVKPL